MLKENEYQESIISKTFRRITINNSLSRSQQLNKALDIQKEEIRMSINLLYVEGTCEKLRHILRSHKIRSTFYTEKTLHKLLYKPKDLVATENKNNIFYEINFSNCQAVTLVNLNGLWNRIQMNTKDLSGIAIMIRIKLLNTAGKQITTLTGIRRKLLIGKAG